MFWSIIIIPPRKSHAEPNFQCYRASPGGSNRSPGSTTDPMQLPLERTPPVCSASSIRLLVFCMYWLKVNIWKVSLKHSFQGKITLQLFFLRVRPVSAKLIPSELRKRHCCCAPSVVVVLQVLLLCPQCCYCARVDQLMQKYCTRSTDN